MRVAFNFTTQTNLQNQHRHIYFRRDPLTVADRSDLESYTEYLRAYYGIPQGRPVFPTRQPEQPSSGRKVDKPRRATGVNRADHPWRGTL